MAYWSWWAWQGNKIGFLFILCEHEQDQTNDNKKQFSRTNEYCSHNGNTSRVAVLTKCKLSLSATILANSKSAVNLKARKGSNLLGGSRVGVLKNFSRLLLILRQRWPITFLKSLQRHKMLLEKCFDASLHFGFLVRSFPVAFLWAYFHCLEMLMFCFGR